MIRLIIAAALLLSQGAFAQCTSALVASGNYGTAQGASGDTQYVVYMPQPLSCFNGDVILFAHGYVPVGAPAGTWLSQLQLPDGTSLPALVNQLGFGFAASSYSKDGLAVLQGIQDTKALVDLLRSKMTINKVFITGASEGGLVTTKSVEDDTSYAGGLAVCGPIGSFRKQLNYFGDARVLFDYFFPGVLGARWTKDNMAIPGELMLDWTSKYEPAIINAVKANPLATFQFLTTSGIAIGLNPANAATAIVQAIWYNVFATNDARTTLGGNPFDNIGRYYTGSFNDRRLNAMVARFSADSAALTAMGAYETSGFLRNPLVTLHTTADPQVPFWHEPLYWTKAASQNSLSDLNQIPVLAFGHCNVSATDAKVALGILLLKTGL
jgi:alpha-beta hydrolase superfamily lysophospholipase